MAFSEIEMHLIDRTVGGMCRRRNRPEIKDELSLEYTVDRHDVVIFERRRGYRPELGLIESPIAKLKYVRGIGEWRLYWMRQDLKWHGYEPLPSSERLEELVAEIDEDSYACFFG